MSWINTVIFDLDGTLLDTLEDLADSVNAALSAEGFPVRTLEEIRTFVGNGAEQLIRRSIGNGVDDAVVQKVLSVYKAHYDHNCQNKTVLYPGIAELLEKLKADGYKMAIVSNKHQEAVKPLYEAYFETMIDVAIGQQAAYRKKPDPDSVFLAIQALDADRERAVYIGDSEVDLETAKRANLPCVLVTWGFRDRKQLEDAGGVYFADTPAEILSFLNQYQPE
ncbi:HAD-IA family hydrolase [Fusibacter paucivorans]|uniref:HAD-IA family hydrolase n=1 Tax=Fusibacter paucivorans TaxID=76009 RepID=A0ABS5PM93_9FIRM|nr:HAD-IA family hydrolase [Fusibacter paucivorans]MBS7526299.1 HAD-IA family hydrolase [Fusibacter paucivorans]